MKLFQIGFGVVYHVKEASTNIGSRFPSMQLIVVALELDVVWIESSFDAAVDDDYVFCA